MAIPASQLDRLSVLSRLAAGVLGGYALATVGSILIARFMLLPRAQAVLTAQLLSFAVYTCAILWAFSARTALRAWIGVLIPTLVAGFGYGLVNGMGAS